MSKVAGKKVSAMRALRCARGLTICDMAKLIGVSPGFLSFIENGRRQPPIKRLEQIADVLGVDTEVLVQSKTIKQEKQVLELL